MKFFKLRDIFQTNNRLRNYFRSKDFVPEIFASSLIYKFLCKSCTAYYIGKSYRHFKIRFQNIRVSPQGHVNQLKVPYQPLFKDHMPVCDHKVVHDFFKSLDNESNWYLLEIKESLFFIKRDKSSLNKNIYSQELFLFWVFHIG